MILRIIGLCVSAAIITAIVRPLRPEMAMLIALCGSVVAFMMSLTYIAPVYQLIIRLTDAARMNAAQTQTLIQVLGIALLGECAARICIDAGEHTLASRIELASRLAMLALALPLIESLLSALLSLSRY